VQIQTILVLAGLAAFGLALLIFRRGDGAPTSIVKRGSGRSRIGLVLWWLSLACVGAGLVLVVGPD
jgi:hypothetical protein